jgi:hypothetical protein
LEAAGVEVEVFYSYFHKIGVGLYGFFLEKIKIDNHAILTQRQIGSKRGTEGSSGYAYLRSAILST